MLLIIIFTEKGALITLNRPLVKDIKIDLGSGRQGWPFMMLDDTCCGNIIKYVICFIFGDYGAQPAEIEMKGIERISWFDLYELPERGYPVCRYILI